MSEEKATYVTASPDTSRSDEHVCEPWGRERLDAWAKSLAAKEPKCPTS